MLRGRIRAGTTLVAVDHDAIAGYVIVDESFFQRSFIHLLFVACDRRRRGTARQLLRTAVQRSSTARIFVSTNLSNDPMHALLISEGWTRAGIVDGLDLDDPEVFYYADRAP